MKGSNRVRARLGGVKALLAMALVVMGIPACDSAMSPQPVVVVGPGLTGNVPPTLTFTAPTENRTLGLGENFVVRWEDNDRDSSALISFWLVNTADNTEILLESGIQEDDLIGPSSKTFDTTLIPEGEYNVLAIISDGVNAPKRVFAMVVGAGVNQRIILTVTPPGQAPQTQPPRITMTEPAFNQSVAQDDVLHVAVQPSEEPPVAVDDPIAQRVPYDPDSTITLYILLDFDLNPHNDDPANPVSSEIIVLHRQEIQALDFEQLTFDLAIDLVVVPPRPNGDPYYLRATVDDLTNPPVHHYASGAISVVQLAAGSKEKPVDLFDIGRTKSGARFYGFNPGANLGTSMSHIGDFDADGVDDFVLVAQFGNPRHAGRIGEAYGIYGMDHTRFGGAIAVNTISEAVSGVIFEAPPVRHIVNVWGDRTPDARTDGIADVSFVRDLTGDGRPEILFGLPHVHGAWESMDWDPGDNEPLRFGCYPDLLVNNRTDDDDGGWWADTYWYAGGMATMVNSQNRDADGQNINLLRLEETVVSLELVGARVGVVLGDPPVVASASNEFAAPNLGTDLPQGGRISGTRFVAGGYDHIDSGRLRQQAREGLFGQTVSSLGDQNNDGLDEIMFSAPRTQRYLADLANSFPISTHAASTRFWGSITVLPGRNYNALDERDKLSGDDGTATLPILDQQRHPLTGFGACDPASPRHTDRPVLTFEVFAEDMNDMLGGARSAGDFNRDGIDDIVCGAPLNDLDPTLEDTGAVYILYGRDVIGDFQLSLAEDPLLRPPMLRIRGVTPGDQIGWEQEGGFDFNGDGNDDVLISSPTTDSVEVPRTTCHGLYYCGEGTVQLSSLEFSTCKDAGTELFCDDRCKAFDYDNDGIVDDEDEDVFVCLFQGGANCCEDLVDNGLAAVIFGGVLRTGDRTIEQIATPDLPGVVFRGSRPGHYAGTDASSAGDFNRDSFGDILITVPGEIRKDREGRDRMGVVYLIFGGTHLTNTTWNLEQVGTPDLPGIVFLSPFVAGRPNEAAPTKAAFIGDINDDGFGDIAIGNPMADFIDSTFPQGPEATDSQLGRRRNTGDVYIVYGNNFGSNRGGS